MQLTMDECKDLAARLGTVVSGFSDIDAGTEMVFGQLSYIQEHCRIGEAAREDGVELTTKQMTEDIEYLREVCHRWLEELVRQLAVIIDEEEKDKWKKIQHRS